MAESLPALQLSRMTAEIYPKIIRDLELAKDQVYSLLFRDGDQVTPDAEFSREFYKTIIFETGEAGAYEYDDIYGNNMLSESAPSAGRADDFVVYGENFSTIYPGLNEMSAPAVVTMRLQLTRAKGGIPMPQKIMEAIQNGAFVNPNILTKTLRACAKKVVSKRINALWKEQDTSSNFQWSVALKTHASHDWIITRNGVTKNGAYVQLFVGEDGSVSTSAAVPFAISTADLVDATSSYGSINRIANGQSYDLYYYLTGTLTRINAADQAVWVSNLDPLGDSFHLKIKTGSSITLPKGVAIYLAPRFSVPSGNAGLGGTKSSGAFGWKDWVKATGTLGGYRDPNNAWAVTGSINLANFPMLRSYIPSGGLGSANFDMFYLAKLYAKCLESGLMNLTHIIGRRECFLTFWDSQDALAYGTGADAGNPKIPMFRYNRNADEVSTIRQGFKGEGGSVTYESMQPKFVYSSCCWRKTLLGIDQTDNNWRIYVPNYDLPGESQSAYFNKGIKFTAKTMGSSLGIWKVKPSEGAIQGQDTDMLYAPFQDCHQFGPEHSPVSVLVTGVGETTLPTATPL